MAWVRPWRLYLGTAGVGHITLVDHDTVDMTNLQRQIVHTMDAVGQPKVLSAQRSIARHQSRRAGHPRGRARRRHACWTRW